MDLTRVRPLRPLAAPARIDWPGAPPKRQVENDNADIALKFETLIAETLLRSARAAKLGDDGLGGTGDNIRDMVDHQRAEAIARAAPLGIARILAADAARSAPAGTRE